MSIKVSIAKENLPMPKKSHEAQIDIIEGRTWQLYSDPGDNQNPL